MEQDLVGAGMGACPASEAASREGRKNRLGTAGERRAGMRAGSPLHAALRLSLQSPAHFSRVFLPHRTLRPYQATPANAIAHAVLQRRRGLTTVPAEFAAVFARQSGKDEMLAG